MHRGFLVDVVGVHGVLPAGPDEGAIRDPQTFRDIAAATSKPVIAICGRFGYSVTDYGREFQERAGIPFLQGIPQAIQALSHQAYYVRRAGQTVNRIDENAPPGARFEDDDSPAAVNTLVKRHGVLPPPSMFVTSAQDIPRATLEMASR